MANHGKWLCIVVVFLLAFSLGSALATEGTRSDRTTDIFHKFITGDEEGVAPYSYATGASRLSPNSGVVASPGITWYDYQHNGSMSRQVVYDGVGNYVHFLWMYSASAEPSGNARGVAYNVWDMVSGGMQWDQLTGGGKLISSGQRAGYVSLDVTDWGAAVVAFHEAVALNNTTRADYDVWIPLGYFDSLGSSAPSPPTCQGWVTGGCEATSDFIWPSVEGDMYGEDTIIHVVSIEAPDCGDNGEIQTIGYYRKVNNAWPACATAIDSVYNISQVVRSDTNSNKVAIVYLKPMYYAGDPMDVCGFTKWQNDVVYKESSDGGLSFINETATYVNVTDYSQGHTLGSDEIVHMAYTDVSALYDSDGNLHIVWNTPVRDMSDPCSGMPYASRMWHWDDFNQCISLVYDATRPRFHCQQGAFMHTIGKMSISECAVDETTRLYVMFSRMGAHTTANGDTNADCSDAADFGNFANSDIYVTGSADGGLTWGPNPAHPDYSDVGPNAGPANNGTAVNLTNTQTDECLPGDCLSEHWGTMSKYNIDSLHIMYVEDHDAGAGIRGTTAGDEEGVQTENPLQYAREGCFNPVGVCGISTTPVDVSVTIAPSSGTDCTVPTTAQFNLTFTNTGSLPITYTAAANQTYISPANTGGAIGVGCTNTDVKTYTVGPITSEGQYTATITVTADCGVGDPIVLEVDVTVTVDCYPAEYRTLSTACWSIGVWNTARAGTAQWDDPEGNMYWFLEGFPVMYDESIIITYADETCDTWFSMFDGSNSNVDLVPLSYLTTATFSNYEYAHALFANGDTTITGEIEYYLPTHPDTCVLIEHFSLCNNADTTVEIHVGLGIDWDIPDGAGGSTNQCGKDEFREMVYQYGPPGGPEENYYGGVSFYYEIPGAIILQNDEWVYPNDGYYPCDIGELLATHSGFSADCSGYGGYSSVYVISQNLVLEPNECITHCNVKTSTLNGLAELQDLIDKGKEWIECPEPPVGLCPDFESSAKTSGDLKIGTEVRNRFLIYQTAFDPEANSLSFKVAQKEPWIFINGWEITVCGFDDATSTRVDAHTVSVSVTNGTIAYNDYIEADITLYLTSWNTVRVFDVLWGNTFRSDNGGMITETVKACPDFGWVIEDPAPKGGDTLEHRIILYNDDEDETFAFTDIGLWLSDEYVDIVSEVPEYPDSLEGETLAPGESMTDTLTEVGCTVGDADGSGDVDIDDVVFLISFIFSGGPPPSPYGSGDADCSGGESAIDIDDVVYLIAYIFSGGDPPGLTCNCYGSERRARGLGHIYGTFKIETGRGNVVVINWIDHPTD